MKLSYISPSQLQKLPSVFAFSDAYWLESDLSSYFKHPDLTFYPPLTALNKNDTILLLDGYARLQFLEKQEEQRIPCILIPYESYFQALVRKISWEQTYKPYSCFEKARLVFIIEQLISEQLVSEQLVSEQLISKQVTIDLQETKEINIPKTSSLTSQQISELWALMDGESYQYFKEKYLSLCQMIPELQRYCIKHHVPCTWAARFSTWNHPSQNMLLTWIQQLHLSFGDVRKLYEWITDLALQRQCLVTELLSLPPFQEILEHTAWKPPVKRTKVLRMLEELRYPTYFAVQKDWNAWVQKSPTGIDCLPPAYFEGKTLELRLKFSNSASFEKKIQWLSEEGKDWVSKLLNYLSARS